MIACVRKQPVVALYFEFENELSFITSRPGLYSISIHIAICVVRFLKWFQHYPLPNATCYLFTYIQFASLYNFRRLIKKI